MKKIIVACGLLVFAALAGGIVYMCLSPVNAVEENSRRLKKPSGIALTNAVNRARELIAKNGAKSNKKRFRMEKISYSGRDDLSAADKHQLTAIQDALDKEDLKALLAVLPEASRSKNPEVRSEMVDALGWFGEEAMLELLPFMGDRDEDVAQAAMDSWTMTLSEIDNEQEKATLIESAMLVIRDEDGLDSMVMELSDCDDLIAMQTVINLIESRNPKAARVAREHYEFMTGDEYTSLEAAEKWMCDNYEIEDKDGTVSTMTERAAARARKSEVATKASSTRSSSRHSSSTASRGTSVQESSMTGAGDAESGVGENFGDSADSTADEITGDSNELLEEDGGLEEEGESDQNEDGEGEEGVPPPAQ